MLLDFFNNCARKIRLSFEGLSEDMPKIEWVKSVENYSSVTFLAKHNFKAAQKIMGADIIMKAEDGRFFTRRKFDDKPVWHGEVEGELKTFRSPYLDWVLADALEKGLMPLPSRHDIFGAIMARRRDILVNGSDADFKNLDRNFPNCPKGFTDYHTPEDFEDSNPDFAAYLKKNGITPFRLRAAAAVNASPNGLTPD